MFQEIQLFQRQGLDSGGDLTSVWMGSGVGLSSFALVARLLVFQKFLGNCDGVSDGRLAYSMSPKIFPSHKMPLANTTS